MSPEIFTMTTYLNNIADYLQVVSSNFKLSVKRLNISKTEKVFIPSNKQLGLGFRDGNGEVVIYNCKHQNIKIWSTAAPSYIKLECLLAYSSTNTNNVI